MKITFEKTVVHEFTEDFNQYLLKVERAGMRGSDSVYLEVKYKDVSIGGGHLNLVTNFAHIDLINDNQELEDLLVNGIESRNIALHY